MGGRVMSTAKWKTQHRELASRLVNLYRTADGFKYLRLHNDLDDYDLATFTPEGTAILELLISQHRCGKACEGGCAVIHLTWIIEGCPEAGEPITETIRRNHVEAVGDAS